MVSPALEFAQKSGQLVKCKNPLLPKEKRLELFRQWMDSLSEPTFTVYAVNILDMFKFTKDVSAKFANTDAEVADVLTKFPRLAMIKPIVATRVEEHRQKSKLPI